MQYIYATLVACSECNRHGHILFSNGNTSAEYMSQEEAFRGLAVFREKGYIDFSLHTHLTRLVTISLLPGLIAWDRAKYNSQYVAWRRVQDMILALMQHKRQVWPCPPPVFFDGPEDYCRLAEILGPFAFDPQRALKQ